MKKETTDTTDKKEKGLWKYRVHIRATVLIEALGTSPKDKQVYEDHGPGKLATVIQLEDELATLPSVKGVKTKHVESKLPDAPDLAAQVAEEGVAEVLDQGTTVFHRDPVTDAPLWFDYQIRGHFKDTCSALGRVDGSLSSGLRAFKKVIDGLVFVQPRHILIHVPETDKMGICERPLRIAGPTGERTALARSETVPAGSWYEFDVVLTDHSHINLLCEWLQHGQYRGMGQWRNSGKGRFSMVIEKITKFKEQAVVLPEITVE